MQKKEGNEGGREGGNEGERRKAYWHRPEELTDNI